MREIQETEDKDIRNAKKRERERERERERQNKKSKPFFLKTQ